MRGSDDWMKALPSFLPHALAALALALALGIAAAPAAWADEDINVVGQTINVGDPASGGLAFMITTAASAGSAGTVTLTNGRTYQGDLVLYQVESAGFTYAVTAVGTSAFKNNAALTGIEFQSDLTGAFPLDLTGLSSVIIIQQQTFPVIGANAFEGCGQLAAVVFPQKVAGIGGSAFLSCTSLSSVTFTAGAELYVPVGVQNLKEPAIGSSAFERCTALEKITIPAITSTQRSPDYYGWYGGPNTGKEGANPIALSSYFNFFGPGHTMPAYTYAIGQSAFLNCSSLQSVVFEPSRADWGLFAYFITNQANPLFKGCSNLKSVVYEDDQPYYADPDRAIAPGYSPPSYRNVFQDSNVTPSIYYAVDYYATDVESLVSGDDNYASGRYARVEYLRGTPTAAIATSDGGVLAGHVYADAAAYAQAGYADGTVPDPQAVATQVAGLDAGTQWVWKLGATQSRRASISDSCYAYLAPAEDLSAGRIGADHITTMYKLCGQNLSQGQAPTQESPFDVARYYANEANLNAAQYVLDERWGYTLSLDAGETAWFTLDSTVEEGFFNQIGVYAADGTLLSADDYRVTFERYDASTGTLIAVELGAQADGPLLMTVTPGEESVYSGALQEWVLVKGQAGSVKESYTASPAATLYAAVQDSLASHHNTSSFVGPYAVAIGSADTPSALIAAAYAGLVLAPINVLDTTNGAYGFALSTHFLPGSGVINGALTTFPATGRTPSEFAVAAYQAFEERQRGLLGASVELYPWGDTALLVSPGSLGDVAAAAAAYAYAKAAPVFYTEDDGTVSSATLACLAGFDKVAVMGDEALFTVAAFDVLEAALGGEAELVRVSGDAGSAFSLSMAVASLLMDEGLAHSSVVTVTDAACTADAIVALSLSGHEGGLALVSACTADSKLISAFLHERRDTVRVVRLFGRGASHMSAASFSLYESLCDLWKDSAAMPAVGEGDTLVLYGCQLEIGSDDTLAFDGTRLWGASGLAAGSYAYGGRAYSLAQDIEAVADPPDEDPKDENQDGDPTDEDPKDEDPPDDDPKDEDLVDDDPTDDPQDDDTADEDPKDTVPDAPKATGSLTVVPASASAAPKAAGSLTVAPFTVEGGQDTDASDDDDGDEDEGTVALVSAETPLDWYLGAQDSAAAGTGQQAGPGPQAAAVVGSAVLALGAALWFALRRRRNPVAALAGA